MNFKDISTNIEKLYNAEYSKQPPSEFTITEIQKEKIYELLFIWTAQRNSALMSCKVHHDDFTKENPVINYNCIFNNVTANNLSSALSEQLLAERMRVHNDDVSFYSYDLTSKNIIFKKKSLFFSGSFYNGKELNNPQEIEMANGLDATRNPLNSNLVSFVRGNNIFVCNITTNKTVQLSHKGEDEGCGISHFVVLEEFDRYKGSWWRPKENNKDEYHLLVEEYDESNVDLLTISNLTDSFKSEKHRYPKTGRPNAKSNLKLIRIYSNSEHVVVDSLPKHLMDLFPEYEYLTNCGWTPDGLFVWVQLINRLQTQLGTYLLPIELFNGSCNIAYNFHIEYNKKYWVPVNFNTTFLENKTKSGQEISQAAIFCLNDTGYCHLNLLKKSWSNTKHTKGEFTILNPNINTTLPLTSGEWNVQPLNIWVNEEKQIIYFLANKDDPISYFLYSVNYNGELVDRVVKQLTNRSSIVHINTKLDKAVVTESSLTQPPRTYFMDLSGPELPRVLIYNHLAHNDPSKFNHQPPRLLKYQLENSKDMYGLLYAPSDTSTMTSYPTLHYVYAGPGVRLITNTFMDYFRSLAMIFNYYGYALLLCDGRGSRDRGLEFEGHIKNQMGCVELNDQIFFLKNAAQETGLIDLNRVAIHGSSYGGYMSIMAMLKHNDVYKCGFGCSPVTDFLHYDTAYTERYLGLPEDNYPVYQQASTLEYIEQLPRDRCCLGICHGGMDENVHFQHTAMFLDKANKLGLDIEFHFFPSSRHGISPRIHMFAKLIKFLRANLG